MKFIQIMNYYADESKTNQIWQPIKYTSFKSRKK